MTERHITACNRDCPDSCSMVVTVDQGRAVRLQGNPDDPVTQGFLCERTSRFLERQYREDRFTQPLLRKGSKWVPVGWEQALDLVATKLDQFRGESGPASILHYRSGGSLGILKYFADALFEAVGPVTVKRGDICSGAGEAAQETDFGVCDSHDLFDLYHSKTILLWGKNPHVSGPHLIPVLKEARRRGAKVYGIDPVRTRASQLCDDFLQPRPGSDFWLAMAVARVAVDQDLLDPEAANYCEGHDDFLALVKSQSFDEWLRPTGVDADRARRMAAAYVGDKPSALLVGWGMARRRHGSRTVRALDALGAVTGNLGVPGGGVSYYFHRTRPFDLSFVQGRDAAPRTLAEARLGAEILAAQDPPIRMIWVTAGNPVSMLPDAPAVKRGFEKSEFNVVVDTHPTDTTDLAHLILPTRTLLEDDDVIGAYGSHFVRLSEPAIAAPGEVRHELEILRGVAERMGVAHAVPDSIDQAKRKVLGKLAGEGITVEALREKPRRNPMAAKVLFADRQFPTATGKVHLVTDAPKEPGNGNGYPLTLLAVSSAQGQSSQWIDKLRHAPLSATVHPQSAGDLSDGTEAVLESARGSLDVTIRWDENVHPDVVLVPKGGMLRDGRCANVLIAAEETDAGGGAVYYDEPVRLRPRD